MSNVLLALFFISLAAGLLDFVLLHFQVFANHLQYAFMLNSLVLFHPPLLLLYVYSITKPEFKLKPVHLLHSWAFLLGIGLLIPFYYTKSEEIQSFVVEGVQEGDATVFIVISIVGLVYELLYLSAIKAELIKYKRRILEQFSNIEKINLTWLNYVVNIFIVSFVANVVASSVRHTTMDHLDEAAIILGLFGFFYFINSVLLKGLHHNEIFLGADRKSSNTPVNLDEKKELIARVRAFLAGERPFLNPDLTLNQLSTMVDIPSRQLSVMINSEMGQTFFDLINQYRIDEAKKEIERSRETKTTITEIMYKVGFNSKSSFNTAFKKFTGTTPSDYKSKSV